MGIIRKMEKLLLSCPGAKKPRRIHYSSETKYAVIEEYTKRMTPGHKRLPRGKILEVQSALHGMPESTIRHIHRE